MIFEGMPWPLVLPIAIAAMVYGVMVSKKEMKAVSKSNTPKNKKR